MASHSAISILAVACLVQSASSFTNPTNQLSSSNLVAANQCRATCLRIFRKVNHITLDSDCQGDHLDCGACWRTCPELVDDHSLLDSFCPRKALCSGGCHTACSATKRIETQTQNGPHDSHSIFRTAFSFPSRPLVQHNSSSMHLLVSWPRAKNGHLDAPTDLVFALFWRHQQNERFRLLKETIELLYWTSDPAIVLAPNTEFWLIAIGSNGIVAQTNFNKSISGSSIQPTTTDKSPNTDQSIIYSDNQSNSNTQSIGILSISIILLLVFVVFALIFIILRLRAIQQKKKQEMAMKMAQTINNPEITIDQYQSINNNNRRPIGTQVHYNAQAETTTVQQLVNQPQHPSAPSCSIYEVSRSAAVLPAQHKCKPVPFAPTFPLSHHQPHPMTSTPVDIHPPPPPYSNGSTPQSSDCGVPQPPPCTPPYANVRKTKSLATTAHTRRRRSHEKTIEKDYGEC